MRDATDEHKKIKKKVPCNTSSSMKIQFIKSILSQSFLSIVSIMLHVFKRLEQTCCLSDARFFFEGRKQIKKIFQFPILNCYIFFTPSLDWLTLGLRILFRLQWPISGMKVQKPQQHESFKISMRNDSKTLN